MFEPVTASGLELTRVSRKAEEGRADHEDQALP